MSRASVVGARVAAALLWGCTSGGPSDDVAVPTDTGPAASTGVCKPEVLYEGNQCPALEEIDPSCRPTWFYDATVRTAEQPLYAVDGTEVGTIDGFEYLPKPVGDPLPDLHFAPTLVLDAEHLAFVKFTDLTMAGAVPVVPELSGVKEVQNEGYPGWTADKGPGSWIYTVDTNTGARDPSEQRAGAAGLVIVNDVEESCTATSRFVQFLFVDLPTDRTTVDMCLLEPGTASGTCPDLQPPPAGHDVALIARWMHNQFLDPLARHGLGENEIVTHELPEESPNLKASDVIRVDVAVLGDSPRTFTLDGVTWTDPVTGAPTSEVVVQPGETAWFTLPSDLAPGEYTARDPSLDSPLAQAVLPLE